MYACMLACLCVKACVCVFMRDACLCVCMSVHVVVCMCVYVCSVSLVFRIITFLIRFDCVVFCMYVFIGFVHFVLLLAVSIFFLFMFNTGVLFKF